MSFRRSFDARSSLRVRACRHHGASRPWTGARRAASPHRVPLPLEMARHPGRAHSSRASSAYRASSVASSTLRSTDSCAAPPCDIAGIFDDSASATMTPGDEKSRCAMSRALGDVPSQHQPPRPLADIRRPLGADDDAELVVVQLCRAEFDRSSRHRASPRCRARPNMPTRRTPSSCRASLLRGGRRSTS